MGIQEFGSRVYQAGLNRISFLRKQRFENTYKRRRGFGSIDYHKKIARDIIKHIPRGKYSSALDLGCGYGFVSGKLAETIPAVTGVDISGTALSVAKRHNKKVGFVEHDVVDYRSGRYGLIVCVGILPYIPGSYTGRVAKNIDKMLSEGGTLVVFEKVGYTGTRIESYMEQLPYRHFTRRVPVAGMQFIMTVAKKTSH